MPSLAYTPSTATFHQGRSIPFHGRANTSSRTTTAASKDAYPSNTTISVPLTPGYLAQASAYHINSLASPVHARKASRSGQQELSVVDEDGTSDDVSAGGIKWNDEGGHQRRKSNRKGLALKPALSIRTQADRQDSAKFFQALLSAPPLRHIPYSALSPFSGLRDAEEVAEVGDDDLETGEAFEDFQPKMVGRKASVSEKLVRAWPWQWRPPGLRVPEWEKQEYQALSEEEALPSMVPNHGTSRGERRLLRVFIALLSTAVALQLAIVLGIGGLGCAC